MRCAITFAVLTGTLFFITKHPQGERASPFARQAAEVGKSVQIGAYAGGSLTKGDRLEVTGPDAESLRLTGLEWYGESLKAPIYYGLRAIKWFSRSGLVGLMVDFTHIKAYASPDQTVQFEERIGDAVSTSQAALRERFDRLQFSHGHNLLTLNGMVSLPLLNGWIRPYVGLGAGLGVPHVEVRRRGETAQRWTDEYRVTGPALQALAGIQVKITKHVSMFFEYKLNYARIDLTLNNGERLRTRLLTHQGLSGITNTISTLQ